MLLWCHHWRYNYLQCSQHFIVVVVINDVFTIAIINYIFIGFMSSATMPSLLLLCSLLSLSMPLFHHRHLQSLLCNYYVVVVVVYSSLSSMSSHVTSLLAASSMPFSSLYVSSSASASASASSPSILYLSWSLSSSTNHRLDFIVKFIEFFVVVVIFVIDENSPSSSSLPAPPT